MRAAGVKSSWRARCAASATPAAPTSCVLPRITVPAWLARLASNLFGSGSCLPASFGHIELMRRDNVPHPN
jgi:hypothetical protein